MKRMLAVCVLALMSACDSGANECNSFAECGPSSNCTDLVCTPCGADGQTCCNTDASEPTCHAGLTCGASVSGSARQCASCGNEGQACCTGEDTVMPCGSGLTCSSSVCIGGSVACIPGPTPMTFAVGIIDAQSCGRRVIQVTSSSFEQAKECAGTMLGAGELVRRDPPTADGLRSYEVCVNRMGMRVGITVQAFTDGDARVCGCGGDDRVLGCGFVFNCEG